MLRRLAMEPPFRIFARALMRLMPIGIETKCLWEIAERPQYLLGVLTAAQFAREEGLSQICVIEFGVAGGSGLIALEAVAGQVEAGTGVQIQVFGFDAGPSGLPAFCGDHRDHPDMWMPGDFPMDVDELQSKLGSRTQLILGNIKNTVPEFVRKTQTAPVGFAAIDVDLYSSTMAALEIFSLPGKKMLKHVPLYFDDTQAIENHRFAGELLAIRDFNASTESVKIDRWHGVRNGRPFPERAYLDQLFVAHDLSAIGGSQLTRRHSRLPLRR